jgi:hypothetical protein
MAENVMDGVSAIVAEARRTEAERMAKGEVPEAMRTTSRVLAGMEHQVAEQLERLAIVVSGGEARLAHESAAPPPCPKLIRGLIHTTSQAMQRTTRAGSSVPQRGDPTA